MIRVVALTAGRVRPSARFRVRQHLDPLRRQGIHVAEYPQHPFALLRPFQKDPFALPGRFQRLGGVPARAPGIVASWTADVTWLQRSLVDGGQTLEALTGRPRVLDVDDAIWIGDSRARPFTIRIAERCVGVVAGNAYLADHFASRGIRTWIVPTAVDANRWVPSSNGRADDAFVIGWTGVAANFPYLERLDLALGRFLRARPNARLLVVANRQPRLPTVPAEQISWCPWAPEVEASMVSQMDVGLMPLADSEWVRGKCAFKMLQYMAVGIPTVTSPVGVAAELLEESPVGFGATTEPQWYEALENLYENAELRNQFGANGRELVLRKYSVDVVARQLADVFRFAASKS